MNKHINQPHSAVATVTNCTSHLEEEKYHLSPNRKLFIMGTIHYQPTVLVKAFPLQ